MSDDNKLEMIDDSELEKVSGGYDETVGFAAGFKIKCPRCGASSVSDFESSSVAAFGQQYYRCRCGQAFMMDAGGYGTLLNNANNVFVAERV
jgi:hypothetical protein